MMNALAELLIASTVLASPISSDEQWSTLTIDAPVEALMRDPETRAIVTRDFPNIEQHPQPQQIEALSFRTIVPNSRGWFTPEELAKAAVDLSALSDFRRRSTR